MAVVTQNYEWSVDEALAKQRAVEALLESDGWQVIQEAIKQRKLTLIDQLANQPVSDNPADYERIVGEVRGLEQVNGLAEGVVRYCKGVERKVREQLERD